MSEHDETFQEDISALLDGELSEQKARALRASIETSEEPRAIFEAFSAVERALPDAFPEVPAGLHEHILSGVRQAASRQAPRETNTPRQTGRRASSRRFRTALIAAACLVLVITGAATLSGRFFRMGRSGAGADTASASLSGSSQAADAGGVENGVAFDTTAAEEEMEKEGPTADGAPADTPTAEDAVQRLEGIASFAVFVGSETYEGADAVAVVDAFFDSEPTNRNLNLFITTLPEGETHSVQLWYRGEKVVCSLNEDGVEVNSLDELLAHFRV